MTPQYLTIPDGRLAYQQFRGDKKRAGIIFLGGYASDMTGTKASFLHDHCVEKNISFLRFDYQGHGQSSGAFKDGTIGTWFGDACAVFDQLAEGPQILVGSSMGGWMGLMLAAQKPERVKALVGVAAAPDFTEDLMWLRMTAEQREAMQRDGFILDPTAPPDFQNPITLKLIEEARQHLLLRKKIQVSCSVRLLQGFNDRDVPWQHALRITENVTTDDVRLTLIKEGDHRLNRPQDLGLLWATIADLV